MSYFPILSAPFCSGRTTVCNFPPNNWENLHRSPQFVNLTWPNDSLWHSTIVGELSFGMAQSYTLSDIPIGIPDGVLPLLSLSQNPLPKHSEVLPSIPRPTQLPSWRASLELFCGSASTSYQGELDPFPENGSFLSFPPLVQTHATIRNYLLFLNLENSPVIRNANLAVFRSSDMSSRIGQYIIRSNSISCIDLESLDIRHDDLPVFISNNMSGIPLFLAISDGIASMSLEHTHPPSSYVIHGKRWLAQKYLKNRWCSLLDSK